MVDIEQQRVVHTSRAGLIESHRPRRRGEEVRADELDPRVAGQPGGVGQQLLSMPIDDRVGVLDHGERANSLVQQCFSCRVTQAEPTDEHVQPVAGRAPQSQP